MQKVKISKRVGRQLYRSSPTILTVVASVGVVTTTIMAVRATPKAIKILKEAELEKGEDLSKLEIIRAAGPIYIPSVLLGVSTIACIFGAIALVTMAEAEGECEEGKRLVIDTILNRVDSEHFPDTVYEVIYQPNQFSSMWNGRVDRCEVRKDICGLVYEELESRTNYDVVFFTAGEYSAYGVPMFQVGNHYFSRYE